MAFIDMDGLGRTEEHYDCELCNGEGCMQIEDDASAHPAFVVGE